MVINLPIKIKVISVSRCLTVLHVDLTKGFKCIIIVYQQLHSASYIVVPLLLKSLPERNQGMQHQSTIDDKASTLPRRMK